MAEEESTPVTAAAALSVKCPLFLVSAILQDVVEHGPVYDKSIARQKSLLRDSSTKRIARREVVLRKPRLVIRHKVDAQGPHNATRTRMVPIEKPVQDPAEEKGGEDGQQPPPPEGEEGAEESPTMQEIEEEVQMAYVDLEIEQIGPTMSQLESTTGTIRFSAVETDEEMVDLAINVNYTTAASEIPEGLDSWAQSLIKNLKTLSEKMVYLMPALANPAKYNILLHRVMLEKAKRFQFISHTLMRSPSAQNCIRAGSAGGSLQFATPLRPLSTVN